MRQLAVLVVCVMLALSLKISGNVPATNPRTEAREMIGHLSLMFSTEDQYDHPDIIRQIVEASGLPAAQNIIGIDPKWPESAIARKLIKQIGAQLHVYHQGPGMASFGESSKNWEHNLQKMLLEHSEATSFEVDNVDQLEGKLLDWIVEFQKWQREHKMLARLVLKNPDAPLLKNIVTDVSVDHSLISPFVIIETRRGGLSEDQVYAISQMAKQFGMTPVYTYNTYHYQTTAPVIGKDVRW